MVPVQHNYAFLSLLRKGKMRARVKITPARIERLIIGKTLVYTVPPGITELEIVLDTNGSDLVAKMRRMLKRVFGF